MSDAHLQSKTKDRDAQDGEQSEPGALLIRFRGGENMEDAYFGVSLSQWNEVREKIAVYRMTQPIGILHGNGVIIVNLPDVMSIDFRVGDVWGCCCEQSAEAQS